MAQEIERKFLVRQDKLSLPDNGVRITQGYIDTVSNTAVRVRLKGDKAFLTLKGENTGMTRLEFEYAIPVEDAQTMIDAFCAGSTVDKTRYEIPQGQHVWEVDIFYGANDGLVVAEIELQSESDSFERPEWLAEEVTEDARYYNVNLLKNPFSSWT